MVESLVAAKVETLVASMVVQLDTKTVDHSAEKLVVLWVGEMVGKLAVTLVSC